MVLIFCEDNYCIVHSYSKRWESSTKIDVVKRYTELTHLGDFHAIYAVVGWAMPTLPMVLIKVISVSPDILKVNVAHNGNSRH